MASGGPEVKSLSSQCRGCRFDPGWGTYIHHAFIGPKRKKKKKPLCFDVMSCMFYVSDTCKLGRGWEKMCIAHVIITELLRCPSVPPAPGVPSW